MITIALLVLPLTKLKEGLDEKNNFSNILLVGLSVALLMFVLLPQGSQGGGEVVKVKEGESEYSVYFSDISKENKLLCFCSQTCEH